MENRVDIAIPETNKATIVGAIGTLQTELNPFLKTLNSNERKTMPKMGDGTEPFVEKTIEYAKSNPEFMPPYADAAEMEVDFKSVMDLNNILRPLRQLLDGLEDTAMLAGSEAYVASLSYYNSVKLGRRMKMPGAEAIYEDLKKRFEGQGKKQENV